MQYIIGIDGGGTKTKLTVCDLDGNELNTYLSGPSNILSSGYAVAKKSIQEVIQCGILEKGYLFRECKAMCIGVAGAAREHIKKQLEEIIRETGYLGKLIITHDAETALMGGTGGQEGVLIIAGTGAICYGRTKEGKTHRVSGWGHIIGDEGSAYSIGIKIINAVMKAYDGRGKKTILTELLLEHMQLKSPEEIIGLIYQPKVTKQHLASYAILIDKACKAEDEVAFDIIEDTVEALVHNVSTVLEKLNFVNQPIKVVVNGSVILHNEYVNQGFREKLTGLYPKVEVGSMAYDAAYGAALLALGHC